MSTSPTSHIDRDSVCGSCALMFCSQGVGLVWWLLMRLWPKARRNCAWKLCPRSDQARETRARTRFVWPQIILGGTAIVPSALLLTSGFFIKVDISREGAPQAKIPYTRAPQLPQGPERAVSTRLSLWRGLTCTL